MLTIVSHDAGGAEILSSYLRRQTVPAVCVLDGPARAIFARKCAGAVREAPLEAALEDASLVICGTSWQSDLEWRALRQAGARAIPTIAFLDHWVNYRERFVRDSQQCLPREIWVGDPHALRIARATFPGLAVKLVDNPYVDDVRAELAVAAPPARQATSGAQVLYVCEPVREHALRQHGDELHWGYAEEGAAEYFLRHIGDVLPGIARIVVRAHPSEPADKYAWMRDSARVPLEFSHGRSLAEDIAAADVVVGCESMAMVVALYGGKRVLSSIPPGGRPCVLPHTEIQSLSNLLKRGAHENRVA
jgi:hypothetical protein